MKSAHTYQHFLARRRGMMRLGMHMIAEQIRKPGKIEVHCAPDFSIIVKKQVLSLVRHAPRNPIKLPKQLPGLGYPRRGPKAHPDFLDAVGSIQFFR